MSGLSCLLLPTTSNKMLIKPCINNLQRRASTRSLVSYVAMVIQTVLMAVSPVPMQYKRLPPGSSSSILPKSLRPACLRLAPPSAATIERSVPQVKHVDDEASIFVFGSPPPLPPPPTLQRSAAQIKHVDDEVLISVYERSVPLIKRVNDEANVATGPRSGAPSSRCYLRFNDLRDRSSMSTTRAVFAPPPPLPLPSTLQRPAAQIKHVDDKGGISNLPPRTFSASLRIVTTMKSKRWMTSNRIRMSVLSSSLSLTTSTVSISQIWRARLVREKQQEEARANTRSMRACLAEACMEIGDTDDLDCGSNGGLDYSNGDQGTIGLPPLDEDNDDELDDELDDTHLVQPRSHRRHDTRPRAQRNRHAHQAWQAQLPTLVDRYLAWKHNGPEELAGDHVFHVDVIGVF
ncbi:hypothetical protein EV401DRAFT_1896468, partial [Pisolithus croceorrhizus]